MTSARISNVPMQNFRCRGSCCRHVQQEEILSKGAALQEIGSFFAGGAGRGDVYMFPRSNF